MTMVATFMFAALVVHKNGAEGAGKP